MNALTHSHTPSNRSFAAFNPKNDCKCYADSAKICIEDHVIWSKWCTISCDKRGAGHNRCPHSMMRSAYRVSRTHRLCTWVRFKSQHTMQTKAHKHKHKPVHIRTRMHALNFLLTLTSIKITSPFPPSELFAYCYAMAVSYSIHFFH